MTYGIIYTDPPWPQKKNVRKCRPNQTPNLDYPTMSLHDIKELHSRVFDRYCDSKHNVFMWTIDKFLPDTEQFMKELGYKVHARIIWDKGNGIAPAFTLRFAHEYLLWFFRDGNLLKPVEHMRGKYTDVIHENSTVHSKKPIAAYQFLEDLFPDTPKLELFARQRRAGWDVFGNEVDSDISLDVVP